MKNERGGPSRCQNTLPSIRRSRYTPPVNARTEAVTLERFLLERRSEVRTRTKKTGNATTTYLKSLGMRCHGTPSTESPFSGACRTRAPLFEATNALRFFLVFAPGIGKFGQEIERARASERASGFPIREALRCGSRICINPARQPPIRSFAKDFRGGAAIFFARFWGGSLSRTRAWASLPLLWHPR